MTAVVNISSLRVYRTPSELPSSPLFRDPFFRDFFGEDFSRFFGIPRERVQRSLGSGVIITQDGYIITNNHVISKATQIKVSLADKREFEARIVGTDPKTDVAILKIDGKDLHFIPLGDSDNARVGDIVLAIGNPFGIGQTVTMGIISAKGRSNVGIVDYEDFIQTDAAINPGNSGGALVNIEGDLIGINTAIISRTGGYQGIGFAIPSNIAKAVMEGIIEHGRVIRGWLGVSVQEITPQIAAEFGLQKPGGALIVEIQPRSPAAKAGLRRGDIVLSYGDEKIEEAMELRNLVATTPVNTRVELNIWRKGQFKKSNVVIEELPG
ncbi:MAG: Do family serine endopeptidase [Deltaproteobacteria bacterium]|nr:Do family serine endopeptidase [Deltaproteobacteria bacterium]